MNLQGLSLKVSSMEKSFSSGAKEHFKRCVLAVDEAMVKSTPVDTGFARSNWIASLNTPSTKTIEPYSPGKRLGLAEDANATAAIAQAKSIASSRLLGQVLYITNNTKYIRNLNLGSSRQAPTYFVEKSILSGLASVAKVDLFKARVRS